MENYKIPRYIKFILIICLISLFFTIIWFFYNGVYKASQAETETIKVDTIKKVIPRVNVIFVLVSKDIDYNKMPIDEIVNVIEKDTIFKIEAKSPEISLPPQIIKVYKVEDITCPYLKKRFEKNEPGELVYEYSGKVLMKLKDGIIKIYHEHIIE